MRISRVGSLRDLPVRAAAALALTLGVLIWSTSPTDAGDEAPARSGTPTPELALLVEHTAASNEPIPLVIRSGGTSPVTLTALRLSAVPTLVVEGVRLERGNHLAWLGTGPVAQKLRDERPKLARLHAAAQPKAVKEMVVPPPAPGSPARRLVPLAVPGPGLYLIEGRAEGITTRVTALVSDLALVTKRSQDQTLVWAQNRRTGKAWADVFIQDGRIHPGRAAPARTDAQGLWLHDGAAPPTLSLIAYAGEHLAFGSERWFPALSRDRRVHLLPHQPAYRPGERVAFKGIVRRYDGQRHHLDPIAASVAVRIVDARGSDVTTLEAPVSPDLGTFDVAFDLSGNAPTGAWRAIVEIGDAGDAYQASFQVDAYRKPAFEVDVSPGVSRILAGADTHFDIQARFFDGGAVPGARVTWQLLHNRVDRDLLPEDDLVRLFFGTEREAYRPETLVTGEGHLDAQGRLRVPAQAPTKGQDGWLSLRATVQGPDRMHVAGSGGLHVVAHPLKVALRTDRHLYAPEDVAQVQVKVEALDGGPAARRTGVLTVARVLDASPGAEEEAWLTLQPFTTDDRGEATVDVALTQEGAWRFSVALKGEGNDASTAPAHAHVDAWVAGDRPTLGETPTRLEVVADRDHYAPGDVARLLVRAPGAGHAVLASLEGARILRHEVIEGATLWQVQIQSTHAPNVFAHFATVSQGRLQQRQVLLRVPPTASVLTAEVTPDVPALEPGGTSGATVVVRDATGAPVANAEVVVAIVDEALHRLHPERGAPLVRFFHAPRRNDVQTGGWIHHGSVGRALRPRPPAPKRSAPGSSCGSAAPGMREPSDASPPAPATPAPMESPHADPSATGNDGGAVTEDAAMDAEEPEAESPDDARADDGVNLEPSNFAAPESRLALKVKKLEDGPDAVTARKDFRSCVLWRAALRTDAEGRVRLEDIPYADSLTRWRIRVHVVDADTRVGEARAHVVTRKEVSVRLTAPRFLRASDEAHVPVLVRNLTRETRAGGWAAEVLLDGERIGMSGNRIEVAGGTHALEMVHMRPRQEGHLTIRGRVDLAGATDAEERTLPVLPQGIQKAVGTIQSLQEGRANLAVDVPPDALAGTIQGEVRVEGHPIQAVLGALPYLTGYPHGCTEQTLSRFEPLLDVQVALDRLQAPRPQALADLDAMIDQGVERLTTLQRSDGSFGWWPHAGHPDPTMTALVVRSLSRLVTARPDHAAAVALRDRAAGWLAGTWWPSRDKTTLAHLERDALALGALAAADQIPRDGLATLGRLRTNSPWVHAEVIHALLAQGKADAARQRARALASFAHRADDGRVSWQRQGVSPEGPVAWRDDPVETTAVVLDALLRAGHPDAALLDGAAAWLLQARTTGDRWRSTRDTAAAVRALSRYAGTQDLGGLDATVTVFHGDTQVGALVLDRETILQDRARLPLPATAFQPGQPATFRLEGGPGTLVAALGVRYVEVGPAIRAASSGFTVTRRYWQLSPRTVEGRVTWTRTALTETVPTGALIECETIVTSAEARTYVMVSDPHVAGFEPAREIGMEVPGREEASVAHRERYDDATCFFLDRLEPGRHVFRHLVRATHVGHFTALPAQAELMYFPTVRGSSDGAPFEIRTADNPGEDR